MYERGFVDFRELGKKHKFDVVFGIVAVLFGLFLYIGDFAYVLSRLGYFSNWLGNQNEIGAAAIVSLAFSPFVTLFLFCLLIRRFIQYRNGKIPGKEIVYFNLAIFIFILLALVFTAINGHQEDVHNEYLRSHLK